MKDLPERKIIFVTGKNPKPEAQIHRELLWRCLLHGVARTDTAVAIELRDHEDVFCLVSWNELYYGRTKSIEEDLPSIETLLQKDGPTAEDVREVSSLRIKFARFLYRVVDRLSFLVPLIPDPAVRSAAQETERYFRNGDDIARRVRELLKAPLRRMFADGDRILLIAHSLGSVIAYDTLWELWNEEGNRGRVELFMTLGSPLGMRYVQRRLVGFGDSTERRFPGNIRHWRNFTSEGDLMALDPEIRNDFSAMLSGGLTQSIDDEYHGLYGYFRSAAGLNVHRSYGYLVQPRVGRTIARWWRSQTQSEGMVSVDGMF